MNLDVAIKSVVRHAQFSPDEIAKLYVDEINFHGLIYWYNDAKHAAQQVKDAGKGKKNGGSS